MQKLRSCIVLSFCTSKRCVLCILNSEIVRSMSSFSIPICKPEFKWWRGDTNKTRATTVFHRINAPAWINTPPQLLTLIGHISGTTYSIWMIFPAHMVFRGLPCEFHQNQIRVRVCFMSPRQACLFGEIQYLNEYGIPYYWILPPNRQWTIWPKSTFK